MKKLLIASSLLVSSSAMATGFYAGGQAGIFSDSSKIESTIDDDTESITQDNLGRNGAAGGVYAGYIFNLDAINLSIEADYILGSKETESKLDFGTTDYVYKLKRKDTYSASILAGLPVSSDVSVYGRLGYTQSKFSYEQYSLSNTNGKEVLYEDSKSKGGVTVGVGATYQLDQHLAIRFDYRYTKFGKVKISPKSGSSLTKEAEITPTQQLFVVGVQYSF